MRIGIIGLQHESNTFVPTLTTMENFQREVLATGQGVRNFYGDLPHADWRIFFGSGALEQRGGAHLRRVGVTFGRDRCTHFGPSRFDAARRVAQGTTCRWTSRRPTRRRCQRIASRHGRLLAVQSQRLSSVPESPWCARSICMPI
jgi:hypothetical protein